MHGIVIALLAFGVVSTPGEFKAGVARKTITPAESVWMSGYAARTKTSEGVEHDLWAKALALEDAQGGQVVIVTADLIGLPRRVCDDVFARVKDKHGLERRQLVFNASHNHAGPRVLSDVEATVGGDADDRQHLIKYRGQLVNALVEVIDSSLADLSPATLAIGHGTADFAANRRCLTEKGYGCGVNPDGPVDHDVPILKIAAPDGKIRAVLFGYACHNTTLGPNCYRINGDYAGFAQIELEKAMPGATAMFFQLCGGDQNPNPRLSMKYAAKHGKTLADGVQAALNGKMKTFDPVIRTAYEEIELDFARQDQAVFEEELKSDNRYRKSRAKAILDALDAGHDVWHVSTPVQVVGFGKSAAMIAVGGEMVVDYSLLLKREFPRTDLIVAGYANNIVGYIPSRRVLREGGYEADESMMYYGYPGPFADNIEDVVVEACRRLMSRIGMKHEKTTISKKHIEKSR